jgi:hypothetical protein
MKKSAVVIVTPPISEDRISNDLRWLTQTLVEGKHATNHVGGLLGGEYGYGTTFSNDVFAMSPFYWGDCVCGHDEAEGAWDDAHEHAKTCYQQVIRARGFLDYDDDTDMDYHERHAHNLAITDSVCAEMGLDPENGSYVHCTCTYTDDYGAWVEANPHDPTCGVVVPNFLHKPSGSTVNFYKYIGRGMEVDLREDWQAILRECVQSLSGGEHVSA